MKKTTNKARGRATPKTKVTAKAQVTPKGESRKAGPIATDPPSHGGERVFSHGAKYPAAHAGKSKHQKGARSMLGAPSADWARAIANPREAPFCGIPTEFPLAESQKVRAFIQGTAVIGTQSTGFVQWSPVRAMANNTTSLYYSTSAYALATSPVTYAEAGVGTGQSNSPFVQASYATTPGGNQGRVVGCTGSVWYTGTELNLAGETWSIRHPDNASFTGGWSDATLGGFPTLDRQPCTTKRSKITVMYLPVQATDIDYIAPSGSDPLCCLILLKGIPGQTYGFRIDLMFEVVGLSAIATSRTHGDPEGLAAVLETAEDIQSSWVGSLSTASAALIEGAKAELSDMSGLLGRGAAHVGRQAIRAAGLYAAETLRSRIANWRATRPVERPRPHAVLEPAQKVVTLAELNKRLADQAWQVLAREPFTRVRGLEGTFDLVPVVRKSASDPVIFEMQEVYQASVSSTKSD